MNLRTSKNNNLRTDFYFTIYSYIKIHNKLPTHLGTKQAINHYVKKLIVFGAISKIGYGTWEVNDAKFKEAQVKQFKLTTSKVTLPSPSNIPAKKVRGHNFLFKLELPAIKNWENRETFLKNKDIFYIKKYNKGAYFQLIVNSNKVWLCSKSVIVYFNKDISYVGNTSTEAKELAILDFLKIVNHLENVIGVSFKKQGDYKFKISRNHYSHVQNELAIECNAKKEKVYIKGDDDKDWFNIDNSFNLNEAEFTHSDRAERDSHNLTPLFNLAREQPLVLHETRDLTNSHEKVLKRIEEIIYAQAFISKDFMQNVAIRIKALETYLNK